MPPLIEEHLPVRGDVAHLPDVVSVRSQYKPAPNSSGDCVLQGG